MLQIRQAETAMKDGRLDEAFELIQSPALQSHRQGQKLVGRVARALVERGQEHLAVDRLTQAAADCEKAMRLAGQLPEAATLRNAIEKARLATEEVQRREADHVAAARRHLDDGFLSLGEQALADVSSENGQKRRMRDQVAGTRAKAEAAIARARQALSNRDWGYAVAALTDARRFHANHQALNDLIAETSALVIEEAGQAIDSGLLDRAARMVEQARALGSRVLESEELGRIIGQCRLAASQLAQQRPRRAAEVLRRLATLRPSASWLSEALHQAEHAAEQLERLRGGPLGMLLSDSPSPSHEEVEKGRIPEQPTIPMAPAERPQSPPIPKPEGGAMLDRFMLQVDGVGSFLVVRDRAVTIGPVSSSRRPDIGLLADASLPIAQVERVEEDYFLSGEGLGQGDSRRKLLGDGDRIVLGPRCHLKFGLPNAASASGVLHLSSSRLPNSDAKRVILMSEAIIIGPGSSAHVRADRLSEPVVLFVRDSRLSVRSSQEVTVNGRPMDRQAGITIGSNVSTGGISFAVTAA